MFFGINTKSVRFRLTSLYSCTLIFSIAILFVSFYWITKRELFNYTDVTLRSHAARVTSVLSQTQVQFDKQMSSQLLSDVFNETPGMLILITNSQGNLLTASQNVAQANTLATTLFHKLGVNNDALFVNHAVGTMGMRFILLPMKTDTGTRDIVMIGHPIDVIEHSLRDIYSRLFIVFLAFMIPTVWGGYILAGSALRPVAEINQEMQYISSENLKRRVKSPDTHDELDNLTRTFNNLLDHLEEAFIRERQFIGDIAHELKTPLSTLKGTIEVTRGKLRTTREYQKALDELLIDANRLSDTLTNILDLAWSKADTYEDLMKSRVNITDVMYELKEIAEKMVYGKKIIVRTHIENRLCIRGKKDKIFRAILNIIDNAVKYSRDGSAIDLNLAKKNRHIVIVIKDTGLGITKSELPHVYDRFYRGSKTDNAVGSGLGLSIARAVIMSSGGTIAIQSTSGKGTAVTIKFPDGQLLS